MQFGELFDMRQKQNHGRKDKRFEVEQVPKHVRLLKGLQLRTEIIATAMQALAIKAVEAGRSA
jgi:hypothetical protein